MAIFNVSCTLKLSPIPPFLSPLHVPTPRQRASVTDRRRILWFAAPNLSSVLDVVNQIPTHRWQVYCDDQQQFLPFREPVSSAILFAVLSASLSFTNPALAFKGGGPYGQEVTRGQDLSGKDFSGKSLIKQDFKTSILRQTNFKGAKLLGASFFDADLTGADLSDADMRYVDFSLANVTKANLANSNLEGALVTGNTSFKGSVITGADFTDVPLRDDQREYLCKVADGVNPTTGNETRDTLLCK